MELLTSELTEIGAGSILKTFDDIDRRDLQLVVIDCPYHCWHKPLARDLFAKMVTLKLKGFKPHYPPGALPLDTTDFLAIHVLACVQIYSELNPMMGYRIMPLERCNDFNIPFPALSLTRAANALVHARVIEEHIDRCMRDGKTISYLGSWSIHPGVKRHSALHGYLRELFIASQILVHAAYGIDESIIGATLRFKVDEIHAPLGYRPLSDGGEALEAISVAHLLNERVGVMHLPRFTDEAHRNAEKWHANWKSRITIG